MVRGEDEPIHRKKKKHLPHKFFGSTTFYVIIALFFGASVVAIILASIAFSSSGTDGVTSSEKSKSTLEKINESKIGAKLPEEIKQNLQSFFEGEKANAPRKADNTSLRKMISESEMCGHNKYSSVVGRTKDGKEITRMIHIFTKEDLENMKDGEDMGMSKKRSNARKPKPASAPPNGGNKTQPNGAECMPPYTTGFRWRTRENYMISTSNMNSLTSTFIRSAIHTGVAKWNEIPDSPIFGSETTWTGNGPDWSSPDGKNEIDFGVIDEEGVLAFCITLGTSSGPVDDREIIEFDIRFDDRDYVWGNAAQDPQKYHLVRVVVHELGHAAGLGHSPCTSSPMYSSSGRGQVNPEYPSTADKLSICELYGCEELPVDESD